MLNAEAVKNTIETTARSLQPPDGVLKLPAGLDELTHCVATVFQHLLFGIPGGILGSKYLYRVLEKIHDFEFPGDHDPLFILSNNGINLVALAIVALSSEMQLDLICAVFGLISQIGERASRLKAIHARMQDHPELCNFCLGAPDTGTMGLTFGALLSDPKYLRMPTMLPGFLTHVDQGPCDVSKMIVCNWKSICQLLRMWEVFGLRE